MTRTTLSCLLILVLIGLMIAPASYARTSDRSLRLELESVDGILSLASTALGELAAGLFEDGLRCEGGVGGEVRRALLHLERRGEGSRYRFEDGGDRVSLRRRGGQIHVRLVPEDGKRIDLSAPWPLAQCLLGRGERIEVPDDLELSVKSSGSKLQIRLD